MLLRIPLKKSNVVSSIIFLIILFSIFIKYLTMIVDVNYYKIKWEKNKKYIDYILKSRCFYVKKAYLFKSYEFENKTLLFIKLDKHLLPLNLNNLIFKEDGIYLKLVVRKVYLSNQKDSLLELNSNNFLIENSNICIR